MRMSCNGCRVLRKGCSDNCSIRPCLQWIKNPESQANATVFLAKFYGRAGLMNLINAGPQHLRPAIFRSLLYEACGRIVNPIYGSVGLLWSGSWQLCQAAVEAVLKGAPITQIPTEAAANTPTPPLKAYDIRHVSRHYDAGEGSADLPRVNKKSGRTRFKRRSVEGSSSGAARKSPDSDRAPPEDDEFDEHDDSDRVADARGNGFGHGSSDSQDEGNDSADDRSFHELRLMDTAAVGRTTGHAADAHNHHHGSGDSASASAHHHHDSPDTSMVTSHNHGGANSEDEEDGHLDACGSGDDDGEVELELSLGGPKRRRT